eukprot:g4537.t1
MLKLDPATTYVRTANGKPVGDKLTLLDLNITSDGSTLFVENRLNGGQSGPDVVPASPHEFPFLVSLQFETMKKDGKREYKHTCGGSLIYNGQYVATAAHCLDGCFVENIPQASYSTIVKCDLLSQSQSQQYFVLLRVLVNAHDLNETAERIYVTDFRVHGAYNMREANGLDDLLADIAVLKLLYSPRTVANVDTMKIPPTPVHLERHSERYPEGLPVVSPGWGLYRYEGSAISRQLKSLVGTLPRSPSSKLLKSNLYISNLNEMHQTKLYSLLLSIDEDNYAEQSFYQQLKDSRIAASAPGASTCSGDSGGPLLRRDEDGRIYLIGILSWGGVNRDRCDNFCNASGEILKNMIQSKISDGNLETILPFKRIHFGSQAGSDVLDELTSEVKKNCPERYCSYNLLYGGCYRADPTSSSVPPRPARDICGKYSANTNGEPFMSRRQKLKCSGMKGCKVIDKESARIHDGPCPPGEVSIFTRISYFYEWIEMAVQEMEVFRVE